MAVYDLEEQEQLDDLKAWWASYGKYVSAAVVSQAARTSEPAKAKDPAAQLAERFGGTSYAPRGVLLYAKLLYDSGDKAQAKAQLQWVIDHPGEEELKAIARFRIAQVLLDDKQYDEALKALDVK